MSDKLKEATPNTIDNEKEGIENTLDKLEDKIALGMLINIDKQVLKYDIDLAKDGNKYRFIVDNKVALNIPLKGNQIQEIGTFLVELLNKLDQVELEYDNLTGGYVDIEVDREGFLGIIGFDKRLLGTETMQKIFGIKNARNAKGDANIKVREIFRFIQTIRNNK